MSTFLLISTVVLWLGVLSLAFLVLGTLRSLGVLTWRLDHLEMTRPSRIGREGLKVGRPAPDFTLPDAKGREVSLRGFLGRKVLLVFTQSGCGPCHAIVPDLNRLYARGEHEVVVVNNGPPGGARQWADETRARFGVLGQEKFAVSKRYQVYATPFAFLIDEQGVIVSKGIASTAQYLGYVLDGVGNHVKKTHEQPQSDSMVDRETAEESKTKELIHV